MQCKIKKFKPETIKPGRITFIVGKRGCGKTTLLKDLLSRMVDQVDYAYLVEGRCHRQLLISRVQSEKR